MTGNVQGCRSTSFPGSLILPPPEASGVGKRRHYPRMLSFRFTEIIKVPMTNIFFIFLIHSTLGSDVKSEKIFLVAIFLHAVLAVWKHQISLPVGSKTALRGKLGIVALWRVTGNTLPVFKPWRTRYESVNYGLATIDTHSFDQQDKYVFIYLTY